MTQEYERLKITLLEATLAANDLTADGMGLPGADDAEDALDALFERLVDDEDHGRVALDLIEREGYRRCDIPACNCGSWHGGHWHARFREIDEVVGPANGETLLMAVQRLVADSERIEWLETNADYIDGVHQRWCINDSEGDEHEGKSLREAVDAARTQEQSNAP